MAYIKWEDDEWLRYALALAKIHPDALKPGAPLVLTKLKEAMKTMPPERQRPFPPTGGGLAGYRAPLEKIYSRLRGDLLANPPPEPVKVKEPKVVVKEPKVVNEDWRKGPRTLWKDQEYDAMLRVMRAAHPDFAVEGLTLEEVRKAASLALPKERQRDLYSVTPLKVKFAEALQRALAAPPPPPPPAPPAPPAFTEPETPLLYEQLDHTAWSNDEWRQVAEELNRRYPEDDYRRDPQLKALTNDKLKAAQVVLPPPRRRPNFFGLERPKNALWDQFSRMQGAATIAPPPAPSEPEDLEEAQPPVAAAPPPVPVRTIPVPAAPTPDPTRAALDLVAKVFADAFAQALRPVLAELVSTLTHAAPPPPAPPAPAQPTTPLVSAPPTPRPAGPQFVPSPPSRPPAVPPKPAATPPLVTKKPSAPSKPLVGIIGAQPIQQRMLEAAYPQLKFEFADKNAKINPLINAVRDCVRIIAMAEFMGKAHVQALQEHYQHRFAKVMGSGSSVKHQIDIWLHQGVLNEHYTQNGADE